MLALANIKRSLPDQSGDASAFFLAYPRSNAAVIHAQQNVARSAPVHLKLCAAEPGDVLRLGIGGDYNGLVVSQLFSGVRLSQ